MISRRPNSRASIDSDPGPSAMMAASIADPNANANLESNKFCVQPGSHETATPMAPMAAITPAIGVRNPMNSRPPAASVTAPKIPAAGLALVSVA